MDETVTVKAQINLAGMPDGTVADVVLTPRVQGLLDSGFLVLAEGEASAEVHALGDPSAEGVDAPVAVVEGSPGPSGAPAAESGSTGRTGRHSGS